MSDAARARFLDHEGQRIILFDFSGITDTTAALAAVDGAQAFMARQAVPDGSNLTLTDVTQTRYDRQIVERFKGFTAHNRPYVRAAAIVSDSSIHRAAISMLALVSKRRLTVFETRDAALRWLATQR